MSQRFPRVSSNFCILFLFLGGVLLLSLLTGRSEEVLRPGAIVPHEKPDLVPLKSDLKVESIREETVPTEEESQDLSVENVSENSEEIKSSEGDSSL